MTEPCRDMDLDPRLGCVIDIFVQEKHEPPSLVDSQDIACYASSWRTSMIFAWVPVARDGKQSLDQRVLMVEQANGPLNKERAI